MNGAPGCRHTLNNGANDDYLATMGPEVVGLSEGGVVVRFHPELAGYDEGGQEGGA